jgi:NADH-quinone oxidoreductase subunit J
MTLEIIIFFLFAFGVLVTSLLVISFKNPMKSAISLGFSFLCTAGIFALLNAPFLAVVQVMIYAGAVMVLFLFAIMSLNLSDSELGGPRVTVTKVFSGLVVVALCWGIIYAIGTVPMTGDVHTTEADKGRTIGEVLGDEGVSLTSADVEKWVLVDGEMVLDGDKALVGGETLTVAKSRYSEQGLSRAVASLGSEDADFVAAGQDEEGAPPSAAEIKTVEEQRERVKRHILLWDEFGSVEAVGERLYTKWVFPFQMVALLLLATIVGAVFLARRRL